MRDLPANICLFARGDPPDGIYCVVAGAIRVSGLSTDGRETLLAIAEPPQWLGEIALLDGEPRTHDAWTEGATSLLHVNQQALDQLLVAHPEYWRNFGRLVTQKLRMTFLMMEQTALLAAPGRVVDRLVKIAEGYGEWKDRSRRTVRISQEQLASMLALTRQTVNQALNELQSRGLVRLFRGSVEILDITRLRDELVSRD